MMYTILQIFYLLYLNIPEQASSIQYTEIYISVVYSGWSAGYRLAMDYSAHARPVPNIKNYKIINI